MQKNIKKTIIGVVAIISIFLPLTLIANTPVKAKSYEVSIAYGDDYAIFSGGIMDTEDSIYWSFSASNNVYLFVWISDDANYEIYDSGGTGSAYLVSNFESYHDSGTFDIPYEDKWYVIFQNYDYFESTTTSVSITVNFYGVQNSLTLILGIVIPIVIVIGIIALAVGLTIRNKKKAAALQQTSVYQQPVTTYQQPTYYPPAQPVQTQPIDSQPIQSRYCNSCGSANKPENRFCVNCGADMQEE